MSQSQSIHYSGGIHDFTAWIHVASRITSFPSGVPEAKYCQTQIADGHRITRKWMKLLMGVWKADRTHETDGPSGGKLSGWVTHFPELK